MKPVSQAKLACVGRWPFALIGVGLLAFVGVWLSGNRHQAAFSLLTSMYFWLSLCAGALFFTMLHHIVAAKWSVVIRRLSESLALTVIPVGLLFLVVLVLGIHELYPWADAYLMQTDHHLHLKAPFLNKSFFFIRTVVYLGAWGLLAFALWRVSVRDDHQPSEGTYQKFGKLSAIGLLVFALTFTYSSFDWLMSLDPKWYSTIFGLYCFAGSVVGVMATLTLVALWLENRGYLKGIITTEHFHDLGKMLFAFTCFWAYMAFSQYILIWYANIPEETTFYFRRWEGAWKGLSLFLAVGHFAVPFVLSMPKPMKRSRTWLAVWAVWMLVLHYIDIYWLVLPNFHHQSIYVSWMDPVAAVAGGLVFVGALLLVLSRAHLVPQNDPKLEASLHFKNI